MVELSLLHTQKTVRLQGGGVHLTVCILCKRLFSPNQPFDIWYVPSHVRTTVSQARRPSYLMGWINGDNRSLKYRSPRDKTMTNQSSQFNGFGYVCNWVMVLGFQPILIVNKPVCEHSHLGDTTVIIFHVFSLHTHTPTSSLYFLYSPLVCACQYPYVLEKPLPLVCVCLRVCVCVCTTEGKKGRWMELKSIPPRRT